MVAVHQFECQRWHLDQRHDKEYVTFQHVSHVFTIYLFITCRLYPSSINRNYIMILLFLIIFSAVKSMNIQTPRSSNRTNTLTTPSQHYINIQSRTPKSVCIQTPPTSNATNTSSTPSQHHMNLRSRTPKSVSIQTPTTSHVTNTSTTPLQHHMNLRSRTPKSTVVDDLTPINSSVPNTRKGIFVK